MNDLGNNQGSFLNKSYLNNSAVNKSQEMGGGGGSSKAISNAMQALQDKSKRLESQNIE